MPAPDPEPPEPGTLAKFFRWLLDELPPRMFVALAFIAFFFFDGLVTSLVKLSGRDVASLSFPLGPAAGLVAALLVLALGVAAWRRRRHPPQS